MDAPSVNLIDYFNLDFNASLASLSQNILIVPVVLDHYAYLNRIKGYNPSGYTETITAGFYEIGDLLRTGELKGRRRGRGDYAGSGELITHHGNKLSHMM